MLNKRSFEAFDLERKKDLMEIERQKKNFINEIKAKGEKKIFEEFYKKKDGIWKRIIKKIKILFNDEN